MGSEEDDSGGTGQSPIEPLLSFVYLPGVARRAPGGPRKAEPGADAALLPAMERVLGPQDWDTVRARDLGPQGWDIVRARGSLARWTGEAGDAAGARDQYAKLLPIMERVLGPEHYLTQSARSGLALWTERSRRRRWRIMK